MSNNVEIGQEMAQTFSFFFRSVWLAKQCGNFHPASLTIR
jgi:hypothetical protein